MSNETGEPSVTTGESDTIVEQLIESDSKTKENMNNNECALPIEPIYVTTYTDFTGEYDNCSYSESEDGSADLFLYKVGKRQTIIRRRRRIRKIIIFCILSIIACTSSAVAGATIAININH
ncbi:membrane protein US9 [Spheniscid alphaherpesvirus 1]|uniref:Membrane protein US9 n=1 Tax=Spheniscid alphaherpesvirus 1 TaxID=2560777 RepID=A0A1R3TB17_9ALPH|nr:membrane protein US9 [Spheniscid alphaherpesvirus 1]SCO83632.1 membrane protein US9 [Spheniscid alphaherpesvirus 1]